MQIPKDMLYFLKTEQRWKRKEDNQVAKQTTLADIAAIAGVTPTTVQRALKGTGGVGEEQRRRIREIADELNYRPNVLASVLKKGELNIAVVLPDMENENRYYAACLWDGLERYLGKNAVFQIRCSRFTYERSPVNQGQAMKRMLEECADSLDGVISMGGDDPEFLRVLGCLEERHIPYVFVGTDNMARHRLCCISAHNEVAGRLAADLFMNFSERQGGRILLTGDFSIQDQSQNAVGFEKQMKHQNGGFEILKLSNFGGIETTSHSIAQFLTADFDIAGIYSCSARNTVAICKAMDEAGKRVPAVGSDVFEESIRLIREGKLSATIHKRHYEQTYRAIQVLVEHLTKNYVPEKDVELVMPVVAMRGNISCFAGNGAEEAGYIF